MSQELIDQCARGDFDAVKASLDSGADVNYRGTHGNTPLGYSASEGHADIVRYLLDAGADSNGLAYEGASPLCLAAYASRPAIVALLLQHSADPMFADSAGLTPLHFAVAKKSAQFSAECVELLLAAGANPNAAAASGVETNAFYAGVKTCAESPLHWAAAYSDSDTIRHLLENGADKTIEDDRGETAAQWAGRHQRPAQIRALF